MIKKIINKMNNVKKIHLFFLLLLLLLIIIAFFVLMPKTQATNGDNFFGYAWSENIGWISFNNCTNTTCAGLDYGVKYDSENLLKGYAWSPNIGLIKFGGLSGFPSGVDGDAEISVNTASVPQVASLKGWARACAGTINGDCASASRTDGWDGWISLSGPGYGVKFDAQNGDPINTSAAWGSDVVGWIDFSNVYIDPPPNMTPPATIVGFSSDRDCVSSLETNKNINISWSTVGMSSCSVKNSNGNSLLLIETGQTDSGNSTLPISSNVDLYFSCLDSVGTMHSYNVLPISYKPICIPVNKKPGYIEI